MWLTQQHRFQRERIALTEYFLITHWYKVIVCKQRLFTFWKHCLGSKLSQILCVHCAAVRFKFAHCWMNKGNILGGTSDFPQTWKWIRVQSSGVEERRTSDFPSPADCISDAFLNQTIPLSSHTGDEAEHQNLLGLTANWTLRGSVCPGITVPASPNRCVSVRDHMCVTWTGAFHSAARLFYMKWIGCHDTELKGSGPRWSVFVREVLWALCARWHSDKHRNILFWYLFQRTLMAVIICVLFCISSFILEFVTSRLLCFVSCVLNL